MADALITVAGLTVTAGVKSNTLRWTVNIASCLPYLQLAVFEVWSATTNNRASATKVGDATDLSFTHQGLLIGVARYYWVRAKDSSGQYSDFFPLSATSGVAGTPTSTGSNSVGSDELQDNSVGGNHLKADSVTADKISVANLAAISATLGNVAVNGTLLINGSISAGKYADLSILTSKIGANAITDTVDDTSLSVGSAVSIAGGWFRRELGRLTVPATAFPVPIGAFLRWSTNVNTVTRNYYAAIDIELDGAQYELDRFEFGDVENNQTRRGLLGGTFVPGASSSYVARVNLYISQSHNPPSVHSSSKFSAAILKR